MSIVAGSEPAKPPRLPKRRRTIQGHIIVADPQLFARFQRLSYATHSDLFRQARDQGMAPFRLDDEPYMLTRHSDHTYTIVPHDQRNHPTL